MSDIVGGVNIDNAVSSGNESIRRIEDAFWKHEYRFIDDQELIREIKENFETLSLEFSSLEIATDVLLRIR